MSVHRLSAVVDGSGVPTWRAHGVATWPLNILPFFDDPAIVKANGDHFPYAVPGQVDVALRPAPLRTGFWRAVYAGHFQYVEENFLSALAQRAGLDQVDLRRRLLPADSRERRALDAAAARSGWLGGTFLTLYTPSETVEANEAWGGPTAAHPGIAIIGDDGSRERLAFDLRPDPAPVSLVDVTGTGWSDALPLAADPAAFTARVESGDIAW